jgi:ABC-2 type transport system permease protein
MNNSLLWSLVLKDWYFQRGTIVGYLCAGTVALLLAAFGGEGLFYLGTVLLLTVLIGASIHLAMATVVAERTEHTLPFIMSLPISPRDYTTAKMLANVLLFAGPWLTLMIGAIVVIVVRSGVPDGLIPVSIVYLTEILAAYLLVLAVAMVSESQTWTIGTMATTNLFFQGFLYYVSHIPQIAREMAGERIIWSRPVLTLLGAEIIVMVVIVTTTFVLQNRKTDFL